MTQEGRVEDFWTTRRQDPGADDNVRPLLKALAAARRSLDEDHFGEARSVEAVVVDIRPQPIPPSARPQPRGTAGGTLHATGRPQPEVADLAAEAAVEPTPPDWIMVEAPDDEPAQPAPQWGDLWRASVQGWVRGEEGTKFWRPIVTTTTSVPNWDIDTNLGMVTGESACALDAKRLGRLIDSGGVETLRRELAGDREVAESAMVDEAVARGAHAVIGVKLDYTPLQDCLIVTATGTAVTLRTAR